MIPDALLWLSLLAALLTCIAAIGARTLRDFSRRDLQEICQRREDLVRFSEILRNHDRVALGVEMLAVLSSSVFIGATVFWIWAWWQGSPPPSWEMVGAVAVGIGLLLSVLKVWIPWSITRMFAAPFLFHTWRVWRWLAVAVAPLLFCVRIVDTILHRAAGKTQESPDEDSIEEEIRTIVNEGHRGGLLEEDAREMIEGVIELGDADVAEIMTPRTDMHMLHVDLSWEELLADVITVGHTRIPVFDENRDDIVGVLYVKDLLPELARGQEEKRRTVRDLARKPLFVPETKAVDDLLHMFQQMRTHIALVLDEYGGVAGLVTIEDVLEEIVGEIVDEYDADVEDEIRVLDERSCEALGRTHMDEVNEAMGIELPDDQDFDTIGGFVFSEIGRVPSVGESILWNDEVRVTVLEATKRRIDRVRIEKLEQESRESA